MNRIETTMKSSKSPLKKGARRLLGGGTDEGFCIFDDTCNSEVASMIFRSARTSSIGIDVCM